MAARGYSILGGPSQRGVGRAPAFSVARCQIGTQVRHLRCLIAKGLGIGTVTFRIDRTPLAQNFDTIRMGIAVWRVVIKLQNRSIWGACQFSPKKLCAYQRSSGQLPAGTPRHVHGPSRASSPPCRPPGPAVRLVGTPRPATRPVSLRFIGAAPVWAVPPLLSAQAGAIVY